MAISFVTEFESRSSDPFVEEMLGTSVDVRFQNETELQRAIRQVEAISPSQTEPPMEFGEYMVTGVLDKGGMGVVYRGRHERMKRDVAIKVLPTAAMKNEDLAERFHREIEAAAKLMHPNIVTAFDAGQDGDTHYLVMELVDGRDLRSLVNEQGPLPVETASDFVRQAALGLQYAHDQGIVHRDIKPANLLVDSSGTVKILDFGLAHLQHVSPDEDELTHTGQIMGTSDYVAPEQTIDPRTVDGRADIYSLGCTLYQLLCGHPPFAGSKYDTVGKKLVAHTQHKPPAVQQQRPEIPDELADLIDRMLAKRPDERIATAAQVAEALAPFAAGHTPSAQWTPPATPVDTPAAGDEADDETDQFLPAAHTDIRTSDQNTAILRVGNTVRVWDVPSGRETRKTQVDNPSRRPLFVSFSPDGDTLAYGGADGVIHLYDVATAGTRTLRGPEEGVRSVTWADDGKTLVAANANQTLTVWDVPSGKATATCEGHVGSITDVAVSPDGKTVASTAASPGKKESVRIWDMATGEPKRSLPANQHGTECLVYSPDGKLLVTGGAKGDGRLRVWNIDTGELVYEQEPHDGTKSIACVTVSPDGGLLAIAHHDGTVGLCNLQTGEAVRALPKADESVSISPEGDLPESHAADDQFVYVVQNETGQLTLPPDRFAQQYAQADVPSTKPHRSHPATRDAPSALRDAPPVGENRTTDVEVLRRLTRVDWKPGKAHGRLLGVVASPAEIDGIAGSWQIRHARGYYNKRWLSPKGNYVVLAHDDDPTGVVFEVKSGQPIGAIHAPGSGLVSCSWSSDEAHVACCCGQIKIVHVTSRDGVTERSSFQVKGGTRYLAWSPDKSMIAVSGGIRFYSVSRDLLHSYDYNSWFGGRWSPNSKYFAVFQYGNPIIEVDTGRVICSVLHPNTKFAVHPDSLAWGHDSESVYVSGGGVDSCTTLSDGTTRKNCRSLPVVSSPDGRYLLWRNGEIVDDSGKVISKLDFREVPGAGCFTWEQPDRIRKISEQFPGYWAEYSPAGQVLASGSGPLWMPVQYGTWLAEDERVAAAHPGNDGNGNKARQFVWSISGDDDLTFEFANGDGMDDEGLMIAEYAFGASRSSFSPDGTRLAAFSQDVLHIVSIAEGADHQIPWKGRNSKCPIHWTPKGDGLLIDGKLYNLDGRELGELKDASENVSEFQWLESTSGAVGISGSSVLIWPSVKGRSVRVPVPGLPQRSRVSKKDMGLNVQQLSPSGRYWATIAVHDYGSRGYHGRGDLVLVDLQEQRVVWTGIGFSDGTMIRVGESGQILSGPEDIDRYLIYTIRYPEGVVIPLTQLQFATRIGLSPGQQCLQRILDLGGSVQLAGHDEPLTRNDLRDARDLPDFSKVVGISLADNHFVMGDTLEHLSEFTSLAALDLSSSRVNDGDPNVLSNLAPLKTLNLARTQVTSSIGTALPSGLRELNLSNTVVDDDVLAELSKLKSLRRLVLGGTKVTDEGVTAFRDAMPNCEVIMESSNQAAP